MKRVGAVYGTEMREFAEQLIAFDTTGGTEAPAQAWIRDQLDELGFETYEWEADPDVLAGLSEFHAADLSTTLDRPSVGGVLDMGNPEDGKTLVLNSHVDVVPADGEWTGDPFTPRRSGDRLIGRGAVDMKSQLAACVFAAKQLADDATIDGRIVVESVAGEEEGGFGAATAALSNPYPFDRDAAIVAEPTDFRLVTATAGCLMMCLDIPGRPAHAARRWQGMDPLDRFERIRQVFLALEAERVESLGHPLYDRFDTPWPLVFGRVEAGSWASNVPDTLSAQARIGVAPGETLDEVEDQFRERLVYVTGGDDWLANHPPTFERFGVQFEPAEIDADEPIVDALTAAIEEHGRQSAPVGETYGADSRHYIRAGIPTAVFGPGRIEEAHFPDESIVWPDVLEAADVLVDAARHFLTTS